jgi:hypothetical protein
MVGEGQHRSRQGKCKGREPSAFNRIPAFVRSGRWDSEAEASTARCSGNPICGDPLNRVRGWMARPNLGFHGWQKQPETNTPPSFDKEEAKELRRTLQSDDIAPVDYASYGRRVGQIINRRKNWG